MTGGNSVLKVVFVLLILGLSDHGRSGGPLVSAQNAGMDNMDNQEDQQDEMMNDPNTVNPQKDQGYGKTRNNDQHMANTPSQNTKAPEEKKKTIAEQTKQAAFQLGVLVRVLCSLWMMAKSPGVSGCSVPACGSPLLHQHLDRTALRLPDREGLLADGPENQGLGHRGAGPGRSGRHVQAIQVTKASGGWARRISRDTRNDSMSHQSADVILRKIKSFRDYFNLGFLFFEKFVIRFLRYVLAVILLIQWPPVCIQGI